MGHLTPLTIAEREEAARRYLAKPNGRLTAVEIGLLLQVLSSFGIMALLFAFALWRLFR